MKAIGIVKSINIEALENFIITTQNDEFAFQEEKKQFGRMYEEKIFPEKLPVHYDYGGGTYNAGYKDYKHKSKSRDIFNSFFGIYERRYGSRAERFDNLRKLYEYAEKYDQPLHYIYKSSLGYYVETANMNVFIPAQFVEVQPFVDYSDTPLKLIGANESVSRNLPDVGEETQNTLKSKLENKRAEIEEKVNEIKAKEEEQKAEIERMKLAIEEKYKAAFDLMASKKEELEMMMKQLEGQLFVLDTQIYGIRCFFGETVKFTKIAGGENAPVDHPVVMYQKIRFLDEELSKYASIYGFDGDDTALFEELLKNRQDMRNLFFPEGKSLSLVRISKDGRVYQSGQDMSVSSSGCVSVYNVMQEYEVYHGNQIAILVRNGDNCYIGWTELDRIHISDENAFLTPKEASVADEAEVKTDWKGEVVEEKTDKNEVAARFFIFSIAQGLIENSKLLELPEGVSITQNSPYVVFSMADNWLYDSTYGSFDDIMNKCNRQLQKGDMVITLRSLSAEGEKYSTYWNDRGRGDNNRTHDVHAKNNTIYPVNLIEEDKRDNRVNYECKRKSETIWTPMTWVTDDTEENFMESFMKHHDTERYEYRNIRFAGPVKHVFISLKKENWWTDSDARANFELYHREFLNLTFLNTVYVRYIIANRKMPEIYFDNNVNFSYILPYMNKIMVFLKEREEEEEKLISAYTTLSDNWQIALTDWKLEHNVHKITEYQAKRFAKWYADQTV